MEVDTKLKIMDLPYDPIIPLFDNCSKDVQYFTEIHAHQCLLQDSPQQLRYRTDLVFINRKWLKKMLALIHDADFQL